MNPLLFTIKLVFRLLAEIVVVPVVLGFPVKALNEISVMPLTVVCWGMGVGSSCGGFLVVYELTE